jgi:hypothetical protein
MPKKVDRNQSEIVQALRKIGATVQCLHTVGKGCPDLLVGFRGSNFVLEVKDWQQQPARRRLTPDEAEWHAEWRGQVAKVETVSEAFAAIGAQAGFDFVAA